MPGDKLKNARSSTVCKSYTLEITHQEQVNCSPFHIIMEYYTAVKGKKHATTCMSLISIMLSTRNTKKKQTLFFREAYIGGKTIKSEEMIIAEVKIVVSFRLALRF